MELAKCRYVVVEGPIGAGKTSLAQALAHYLGAEALLEAPAENPFLARFYEDIPRYALPTQLNFLFQRVDQIRGLHQLDLFGRATVADFLLDKDPLFARLNLSDDEFALYDKVYSHLKPQTPTPDLVIYLQAPTDVLRRRLKERSRANPDTPALDDEYVRELNEAYNHFFFHYNATPLLVVETSQFDLSWGDETLDDLMKQLQGMGRGTRYYVPRTK